RVSTGVRLAGVHRDQAVAGVEAQPRTGLGRVPGIRTAWPRSRLDRLIPRGPQVPVRSARARRLALGHLLTITLRAPPGLASPAITPAHPLASATTSRGPGLR